MRLLCVVYSQGGAEVKDLWALFLFNVWERIREWREPEAPDLRKRMLALWLR